MTKRFIEFMTQNTDDGELNCGFKDIHTEEWYHTKDRVNAKKCIDILSELVTNCNSLKNENEELKKENQEFKSLLDEMSDCNNEIWLDDGRIYRLRKVFKGKWS